MTPRTIAVMIVVGSFLCAGVIPSVYGQAADVLQAVPVTQATMTHPGGRQPDYLLQGTMNYQLGNYEEALEAFKRAREQDPKSAVVAYYLGSTLKKMQNYQEALSYLKEAVTLQPAVKASFLELADTYYALDKKDEALHALVVAEREGIEPAQTAFLKGLVLMKKKGYAESIASFEKAKSLDPKLGNAADFQIAMVYAAQGKQTEARNLFREVSSRDPESDIGQLSRQQSEALARQQAAVKAFQAVVNVQYQYDSNVVLKPDSASAATNISGKSDTAAVLMFSADYNPALSGPVDLRFQYALYASAYQTLSNYDVQSHTIGVLPTYRVGANAASLAASYNYTLVDHEKYLAALTLAPYYLFALEDGKFIQAGLLYQSKDYLQEPPTPDENRDGNNVGLGISWTSPIAGMQGAVNIKYELNKENTTGNNWSYLGNKIGAGAVYPVADPLKLILGLEAYLQDYDNVNSIVMVKRKDKTYTFNAQALYTVYRNIDLQLQYIYIKEDSNIPLYAFTKNVASIGVYARF